MDSSGATVGHGWIVNALTPFPVAQNFLIIHNKFEYYGQVNRLSATFSTAGEPKPRRTAARRGEATVDQNLVKALGHPLRVEILAVLNDRMASPNELAKALDEGLSQVSYHVKVLKDFDCIRMVKTEPRRGAVEHFYKAVVKAYVTTDAAKKLPKSARQSIWGPIMQDIDYDVETSVEAGTFDKQPHHYVGRVTEILDGQGLVDLPETFHP